MHFYKESTTELEKEELWGNFETVIGHLNTTLDELLETLKIQEDIAKEFSDFPGGGGSEQAIVLANSGDRLTKSGKQMINFNISTALLDDTGTTSNSSKLENNVRFTFLLAPME